MRWKLPPNVHGYVNRHGKAVFYFRRPGAPKVRLRGHPGSAEFMEAYDAAKGGRPAELGASRTVPGTVNAALVSYYKSTAFTSGLAESSQRTRRAILERFREEFGDFRIALMSRSAVQAILNKKTPAAARNWKKALRGLVKYCMSLDMITVDPLAGVEFAKLKSTPHHPWNDDEIAQYRKRHKAGTKAAFALELIYGTGQARCDVVRMGRQHVRDNILSMRRQKSGQPFDIPILPDLQAAIDLLPKSDQLTFLITEQGKPFTAAGFGNWFRARCDEAGLPQCAAHGLRSAAAVRFADLGATTTQLKAWFAWLRDSEAERYTRNADRKRAALAAAKLITRTEIGSPPDPVSQIDTQPTEKTGVAK
jgi:integrase